MLSAGNTLSTPESLPPESSQLNSRRDEVASKLARCNYLSLRQIHCTIQNGMVVLTGTVPSSYLKELAHMMAAQTPGILQVENRLEVAPTGRRSGSRQKRFSLNPPGIPQMKLRNVEQQAIMG